jgi:integrase
MKANLKTKTARLALAARPKVYKASIDHGLTLGYRRTVNGPGSWTAIGADGKGGQWTECFAIADDLQDADGVAVLDYGQAVAAAIKLAKARGQQTTALIQSATIDQALCAYAEDLRLRGQSQQSATMVRHHLGAKNPLLATSLAQVTQEQFSAWCDGLLAGGIGRATLKRVLKGASAAFNLAARKDTRIAANAHAWKHGFPVLRDTTNARNAVLEIDEVRQIIAAAYAISDEFGWWIHTHAETGSRSSQIARLVVDDLDDQRLMMPNSGKGRDRMSAKNTWTSVPIRPDLAVRLREVAKGRRGSDLLLTQADGRSWGDNDQTAKRLFSKAIKQAGIRQIDGKDVTVYALRHSSIVRALKANVPAKTVADWHNTSIREIERHYARYMRNSHDDLIRPALIDLGPMCNVVPFAA